MHGGHSAKPDRPAYHSRHCLSETMALLLVGQLRGADTPFPARLLPRSFQFLNCGFGLLKCGPGCQPARIAEASEHAEHTACVSWFVSAPIRS